MPPGYGGKLSPRPAVPPPPPPSAGTASDSSGPSRVLLAFALVVVVVTLSALGLLLGDGKEQGQVLTAASGDEAAAATAEGAPVATATAPAAATPTTVPGRDMATIWKLDGYRVADGDPSIASEMRAGFESTPLLRAVFRDVQSKEVSRSGSVVALAMAFTLDPSVADEPSFTAGMFAGLKGSVGSTTDTTVSGLKSVWINDFEGVRMLVTMKKDVILMVGSETRANAEAVMVKLLANIT